MKPGPIQDAIRAQPFRPFVIRTVGGQTFQVNHPEFVAMIPKHRVLVVSEIDGGYEIIDFPTIESVWFPEADEKGAA